MDSKKASAESAFGHTVFTIEKSTNRKPFPAKALKKLKKSLGATIFSANSDLFCTIKIDKKYLLDANLVLEWMLHDNNLEAVEVMGKKMLRCVTVDSYEIIFYIVCGDSAFGTEEEEEDTITTDHSDGHRASLDSINSLPSLDNWVFKDITGKGMTQAVEAVNTAVNSKQK